LKAKGVNIWNSNESREFLDKSGLTDYPIGDLGPIYGFQWRHSGAKYCGINKDYSGQCIDQLSEVIKKIRETPNDRRIILCFWNPSDISKMALPPCHILTQFYVVNGLLSCLLYQRSADMGLGIPFNIASYALLTHVYTNHIEPLKEQLKRIPNPFPTICIKRKVQEIDDFTIDNFEIIGYNSHKKIEIKMAI